MGDTVAEPIEEAVDFFVDKVFGNDTLTDDERKELVRQAMRSLAGGLEGTPRWGLSMAVGKMGRDAGIKRRKREAVGFFGNWAKSVMEKDKKD